MFKNIIIAILLGLLIIPPAFCALNGVVTNRIDFLTEGAHGIGLYTTKTNTPEGSYRIFIYDGNYSGGITAIKIK